MEIFSLLAPAYKFGDVAYKCFEVSKHPKLNAGIPDDVLVIEDAIPLDDLERVRSAYEHYLESDSIVPFLELLGGNPVVCIGIGAENHGKLYYYDHDFRLFPMEGSLEEFLKSLKDWDKPWGKKSDSGD